MPGKLDDVRRTFALLAHNYARPEVQDVADFVSDSLELARFAMESDKENILLSGVGFMAETASILSGKPVFMPDARANCPMASACTVDTIRAAKRKHPEAKVVMYINSTAEAKTEADIVCTSANALAVVESLDSDEVLFVPDANLASYVSRFTSKRIIPVPALGQCPTHATLTRDDVAAMRRAHPGAAVLVHPECAPEVIDAADHALGTGGMVRYVGESAAKDFIIGTEVGLLHRLEKENPGKRFFAASPFLVCPDMKMHTLEKIRHQICERDGRVLISEKIVERARAPLLAMLEIK